MGPGESTECRLSTFLDESKKFKDTLHILVTEGADIDIPLAAAGVGSTIVCPDLTPGYIDFGNQFTGRAFSKEIMLHNLDRRPVNLLWTNETAQNMKKEMSKKLSKRTGDKEKDLKALSLLEAEKQEQVPHDSEETCFWGYSELILC